MNALLANFLDKKNYTPLPKPQVNGRTITGLEDPQESEFESESDDETDHLAVKQYVNREYKLYGLYNTDHTGMEMVSSCADSVMNSEVTSESAPVADTFKKYKFDASYRNNELPIDSFKDRILQLIDVNSVVVIHGPTGCGKTTQVPQYIMDDCRLRRKPCKIIVTQPRRIAAINIAQRVCQERGWSLGTVCGYQVGLNRQAGEDTILTYVTTEILLQILISTKNLNDYTHIVIDEVHERNKALDFLMLVVRKFLFTNSPNVKIILMSATMEFEDFSYYFRTQTINSAGNEISLKAPVLNINKKSPFLTNVFHIDQLTNWKIIPEYNISSPEVHTELFNLCYILINMFDKMDEIDAVTKQQIIGSVLIFLPGYHDIEEAHKVLQSYNETSGPQWEIIPIHSSLSKEHQAKAFLKPKPNTRKIILSTNIAESSITVPDVSYVIDFCLTKTMIVNPITKFSTLTLEWASHNNCIQRAGRVGRVADGRVYRLVPLDFYQNQMSAKTTPEMQRAPLENVILYMKTLGLEDKPKLVLSLALSPPNLKEVDNAVLHLKEIGALLHTFKGTKEVGNGDLTFLGRIMAALPIDIHLSKLIVLGHMFSCLRESIIMATGSTIQNLFVTTFHDRIECYRKRLVWADGSCSDFLALLNLYDVWQSCRKHHDFRTENDERTWCKTNYINPKGLKEWHILKSEIYNRLKMFGIDNTNNLTKITYSAAQKPIVLKVIISGAFYPNYFIKPYENANENLQSALKIIDGRDPFRCVYFSNMPANQPGKIYVKEIKKLLHTKNNVEIGFDGSTKVYIEYKSNKQPQTVHVDGNEYVTTIAENIPIDVYESIRKRQLQFSFPLRVLPEYKAWEFAKKLEEEQMVHETNCFSTIDYSPIPSLDTEYITIFITSKTDTGYFYCQHYNNETTVVLNKIYIVLNNNAIGLKTASSIIVNNKIYVTIYHEDRKLYRCKVLKIVPENNDQFADVLFIDFGNMQRIQVSYIFELPDHDECLIAPIAMCCRLSEFQPRIVSDEKGLWSENLKQVFKQKTDGILLHAKVFSVVDDVVSLELYLRKPGQNNDILMSLNNWLIEQGQGQKFEECLASRRDHDRRIQVLRSDNPRGYAVKLENDDKARTFRDFEYPEMGNDSSIIFLRGPHTPLEMKVFGLTRSTSRISVNIEQNSVNCVLLNNNPRDNHSRLLVAGQAIQSATGDRLKLSHTTLMPAIPGFPMFMSLLFCPIMEPRLTVDGIRVGAILCGLGCQKDKRPYYPQHDLTLNLDTELTSEIFLKINEIRYIMNQSINIMQNIYEEISYPEDLHANQAMIKDNLFQLLHLKRKSLEPSAVISGDAWGKLSGDGVEITKLSIPSSINDIWPLQWFVRLNISPLRKLESENLGELKLIAQEVIPPREIVCQLCNSKTLYTVADVRYHLFGSSEHEAKYEQMKNSCN